MSAAAALASSLTALTLLNDGLTAHESGKHPAAAEQLQRAAGEMPASLAVAGEWARLLAAEDLIRSDTPADAIPLLKTTYQNTSHDAVRERAHQLWVAQGREPAALLPRTQIPERFRNFLADAQAGAIPKVEAFLDGEILEMTRLFNLSASQEMMFGGKSALAMIAQELADSPIRVHQLDPATGAAILQISEDGAGNDGVLLRLRVTGGEWRAHGLVYMGDLSDAPIETGAEDSRVVPPAPSNPAPSEPEASNLTPEQKQAIAAAIRGLAARTPAERQQAREVLIQHGPAARPWLEAAALDEDPEISESAAELIRRF
ncbi:MAG: hypothetical protein KBA51_05335 [Kiritimatiellae bacterium]|nr:hypothetical protein [Kiritimatiellia bacterium]